MINKLLAVLLTCSTALGAATDWMVSPGQSIQAAISQAQDGDRVLVEPGTYYESINLEGKLIEVIGIEGSQSTTIDASGVVLGPAINLVADCPPGATIQGFRVVGSAWSWKIVYMLGGNVTLRDLAVVNQTGACFHFVNAEALLENCRLDGISGATDTVYVGGSSILRFAGCSFDYVQNTFAVRAIGGEISFEGCRFVASARSEFRSMDGLAWLGCEFEDQIGDEAVLYDGYPANGVVFDSCDKRGGGRLLYIDCNSFPVEYAPVHIRGCQFQAMGRILEDRDGVGLVCEDSVFSGCSESQSYGVLYLLTSGPSRAVTVSGCSFIDCRNPIRVDGGNAQVGLDGCEFVAGVASINDDAQVRVTSNGSVAMNDCLVEGCAGRFASIESNATLSVANSAMRGFDLLTHNSILVYAQNSAAASIENSVFAGVGDPTDFVIYSASGPIAVSQCTVVGDVLAPGRSVAFSDSIVRCGGALGVSTSYGYCNVEGGAAGAGNFDLDPLFLDAAGGDYNIAEDSPCVGAGSSGQDIGAFSLLGFEDCDGNGVVDTSELDGLDCNQNGVLDSCEPDCNNNGSPDDCDVDSGFSLDCNDNGVPDECEVDCNGNGTPDDCDIASGFSLDLDGDGIPDECKPDCDGDGVPDYIEIFYGTQLDCNGNEVPDDCDLLNGTSLDCNGNGIPDECDILSGVAEDCNGNGVPDSCDLLTMDCNGNGVVDACDIASGFSQDLNQDGFPDECKPDCNGNGIPDYLDIQFGASFDCDGNDVPDECETDCNGNGIVDGCDIQAGTEVDCNGNGLPDSCELADGTETDCDGDGVLDSCQMAAGTGQDCNQNGALDACDIAKGISIDCDGNGIPDECETDCNGNGIVDACDISAGTSLDCNGNGIPDECEIADGSEADCNGNGALDSCEIANGDSQDCNVNGIPDECEADCNGNGFDDTCDLSNGTSQDCNGNFEPDECDIANGLELDCNGNGIPDSCDLLAMTSLDCNGNGIPDECDIATGLSADCDGDGIPDECQIDGNPNLDLNLNGILDSCECQSSQYCTTSPNSVGSGAVISYSGTAFVSFNDLTLIATGVPPSQFGIFFYGTGQINVANGNGTLCVGGLHRLPATLTNASGTAAYSVDLTSPPAPAAQIDAGETWNFQFWYRDQAAGGSGYNFSDGLSITFCP